VIKTMVTQNLSLFFTMFGVITTMNKYLKIVYTKQDILEKEIV
jgi:hypothetical protein